MVKEVRDGGLKAIDFECLNGTLKINWMKSWLNNAELFWYCIPNFIFNKIGGLKLLLLSDFNIDKLPIKLSDFHKQVLLYWKLLYVDNYSPHGTIIWNNRYILYRNKSLFYEEWMNKNIWSVVHLMKSNGELLSYEQLCSKYKFNPPQYEFTRLLKALPKEFIFQTQNIIEYHPIIPKLGSISIQGISLTDKKCNNHFIRHCLNESMLPGKVNKNEILYKFDKASIMKLRTSYLKLPIQPKVKETHYKIMNAIYPSKELLRKRFNIDDNTCTFCQVNVETTDHIFFECIKTQIFWKHLQDWIQNEIETLSPISRDIVTFGTLLQNKNDELCCNLVLCLAKFFIHKQRLLKSPPIFKVFFN